MGNGHGHATPEDFGIDLKAGLSLPGLTFADRKLLSALVPSLLAFPGYDHSKPAEAYIHPPRLEPEDEMNKEVFEYHGVLLMTEDEDEEKDDWFARTKQKAFGHFFIVDTNVPFETADEGEQWIRNMYGDLWPKTKEFDYEWRFDTDQAHCDVSFLGFGCHMVRKVRPTDEHVPDNTVYLVDISHWSQFEVREGFARFGCIVYFDANKQMIGIHVSYLDRLIRPGDDEWEHAKYVYRCTLFTNVSMSDHVITSHLVISTALVNATRLSLSCNHPLRRFLKPFTFRSANVNYKIVYRLGAVGGLLARAAMLPDDMLIQSISYYTRKFKFAPFSEVVTDNGMENEDPSEYGFGDVIGYEAIVRKFVKSYLDIYYGDWESMKNDDEVMKFLRHMARGLIYDGVKSYEDVIEMLTTCIVGVTGYHEHGGTVAQYVKRPDSCGAKIRPGQTMIDRQAFMQVSIIGAVTAISSPRLMNDWTYLLLKDKNIILTKEVFRVFMEELKEYSGVVEGLNAKRNVPFMSFYPRVLECSVSV